MKKRYQIFLSSTFEDLREERQAVIRGIISLEHFPSGMELFAAGDDPSWKIIQKVILNSDYYLIITAGRYGSIDEYGISYTEREYNFAMENQVPIIALLHKDPKMIPRDKTESTEIAWGKLIRFLEKIKKSHYVDQWQNIDELELKATRGIIKAIEDHPRIGWIKADALTLEELENEIQLERERELDRERRLQAKKDLKKDKGDYYMPGIP
jgi:hypothetical protein